jgi:hypothetical protein
MFKYHDMVTCRMAFNHGPLYMADAFCESDRFGLNQNPNLNKNIINIYII